MKVFTVLVLTACASAVKVQPTQAGAGWRSRLFDLGQLLGSRQCQGLKVRPRTTPSTAQTSKTSQRSSSRTTRKRVAVAKPVTKKHVGPRAGQQPAVQPQPITLTQRSEFKWSIGKRHFFYEAEFIGHPAVVKLLTEAGECGLHTSVQQEIKKQITQGVCASDLDIPTALTSAFNNADEAISRKASQDQNDLRHQISAAFVTIVVSDEDHSDQIEQFVAKLGLGTQWTSGYEMANTVGIPNQNCFGRKADGSITAEPSIAKMVLPVDQILACPGTTQILAGPLLKLGHAVPEVINETVDGSEGRTRASSTGRTKFANNPSRPSRGRKSKRTTTNPVMLPPIPQ